MKQVIDKLSSTMRQKGIWGVMTRIFRYLSNVRARRESLIWFWKRLAIGGAKPKTLVHGFTFFLHPDDPGISRELAVYHVHEPLATDEYLGHVKEGMTIIDVGSNLGYYALLAARKVGQSGRIIAIEPDKKNFSLLKMNIEANAVQNIEVQQIAVGDTDGIREFYLTEKSNTNSLLSSVTAKIVSSVSIATKSLDTIVREYQLNRLDLVRMDIEGGEIIAIKGMSETLTKFKPILAIELHCDAAGVGPISELLEKLKCFGYQVQFIIDRDADFSWRKSKSAAISMTMDRLIATIDGYRVATVFLK